MVEQVKLAADSNDGPQRSAFLGVTGCLDCHTKKPRQKGNEY
jgi:hypothetical protein